MGIRFLVALSVAGAALSLAPSALADGSGGGTTTTSSAAATSSENWDCTVSTQETAGRTCQECDPTGSACNNLSSDYHFFCNRTANAAVWCNGPIPDAYQDQNVSGCSVATPGAFGGAASAIFAVAAALAMRRRRRP